MTKWTGLDDFREKLEADGWKIWKDNLKSMHNECNWIAAKRIPCARQCETNGEKTSVTIRPHVMTLGGTRHASARISIHGEYGGDWYKLECSFHPESSYNRIPDFEARIIKAWEALAS